MFVNGDADEGSDSYGRMLRTSWLSSQQCLSLWEEEAGFDNRECLYEERGGLPKVI